MKKNNPWFSFSESAVYNGTEPAFFDVSQKKWKKLLEDNYQEILSELQHIISTQNKNIVPYYNQTLASTPTSWTIFPLMMWGKRNQDNCNQAKKTTAIFNQIDGVMSCGFSILKPNTKIKPHFGDTNVMYRCHLTLKSFGTIEEIGMRVANEKVTWKEGKLFAFCDAHNHEVWNNTNKERWILIIDVLREEFMNQKNQICKEVNASLWWQLKFQNRYFIKHLPKWSRKLLMKTTALFMKID